jgi:hypothetical protein
MVSNKWKNIIEDKKSNLNLALNNEFTLTL